jgi:hypothetical protein
LLRAQRLADYSAHAALTKEICTLLEEIPRGQPYPDSLSELELRFPDGGDESLLERFEYSPTATTCTVRTVLDGKEIVQSFPHERDSGRNDGQ